MFSRVSLFAIMTPMSQEKNTFKSTLNLPKTNFSMKANLSQKEPARLATWLKTDPYHTLMDQHRDRPAFIFHDGPPYANGSIHIGHLLNKVLKDLVVRSRYVLGERCEFIPGWDCHGLPIEHKVLSTLSSEKKEKLATLSADKQRLAIRNECHAFAQKYIKQQAKQMQRLLTLADYTAPYRTYDPAFEAHVLTVFADMVKDGLVFRQKKPVHWSVANQTALADAELEYMDKVSPTVGVKFPITRHALPVSSPVYAVIWTTTPWTLPANRAIAFGPTIDYVLVDMDGDVGVIANDRLEFVQSHVPNTTVIAPVTSDQLAQCMATHPFIDRAVPLLPGDFVTTDDGTGLVHIAPGHGMDDYLLGQTHELPVDCPVTPDGHYDESVPDWLVGASIWDANALILDHLHRTGHRAFCYDITHSYPHDWRSKTPVIFRSTDQWFIGVDRPLQSNGKTLRDMALHTVEHDVTFHPKAGQSRLSGMLLSRPDWCISRQRVWGLPIPAFQDANGTYLLTQASVRHIATIVETEGSDAWFKQTAQDLLRGYDLTADEDAPAHFDVASAETLMDIFDVWFESGSSWFSVISARQGASQADLYLEGSDQHRGWFHLSLLTSLAVRQQAPYAALLTHGFIVDKNGRKMSKSVGNALNVDDILSNHGAEVMRWWVSTLSYENDIKVDPQFFLDAGDLYRKIRNTFRFMLSNLAHATTPLSLTDALQHLSSFSPYSLDAYILHRAMQCEQAVLSAYASYQFRDVSQQLYQFCNDELSALYLSAIKDRLYCDKPDAPRRQQAQITLFILIHVLVRLFGPILPHTCDEIMESLEGDRAQTVQGLAAVGLTVSLDADWAPVLALRKSVMKELEIAKSTGIENSLDAGVHIPATIDDRFLPELPDMFGVSRVEMGDEDTPRVVDLRDAPRCERSWKRDQTVKRRDNGHWLSDRDYDALQ